MTLKIPKDGTRVALSGDQVKFIRLALGMSQKSLADMISVSQPQIHRLEQHGAEKATGPAVILIDMIAKRNRVSVPAAPEFKPAS